MTNQKYFEKTGSIYGVSSKYNNGWHHIVTRFTSLESAEAWLETEQYDFRERELCSKAKAVRLAGSAAVTNA